MGGHVFYGSAPIEKDNIKPTLSRFFRELGRIFPGAVKYFENITTLGSTGKKDVSGDIDLALDENAFKNLKDWDLDETEIQEYFSKFQKRARSASKQQLMKRAVLTAVAKKVDEEGHNISIDTKSTSNGVLFFQFPQFSPSGEMVDKSVQIDVNVGNVDWLSFSYYSSSYKGNVKGLHRTQLMLCLFLIKGYVFSHNYGVKDKETGKVVASTPEQAINLLNDLYDIDLDQDILSDYFKLQEYLRSTLDKTTLQELYRAYLKVLDSTRCDIPEDMENIWLDNQEKWGLTGKFLPPSSKLYPFRS